MSISTIIRVRATATGVSTAVTVVVSSSTSSSALMIERPARRSAAARSGVGSGPGAVDVVRKVSGRAVARGRRIGFRNRSLDFNGLVVDVVHPILQYLVDRHLRIERDESEPSGLVRLPIVHDLNRFYFSERSKIGFKRFIARLVMKPADEDFLRRGNGRAAVDVSSV